MGGGVKTTAVTFLVSSQSEETRMWAKNSPKCRGRKNPPPKNSQAGRVLPKNHTETMISVSQSVSLYGFLSW
jgi:hypothetical protein